MKYIKKMCGKYWLGFEDEPPVNQPIWACEYQTTNTEKTMGLKKKPVRGMIDEHGYFHEFKLKSDKLKQSGGVNYRARQYADTKEECVEIYNSLIDKQVSFLRSLLDKCIDDYE